jgi:hypothetical protein
MAGAQLRHALRGHKDGGVLLTVHPRDGRAAEKYRVEAVEMRRFAWSVLSDLAPAEAAAVADEDGVDLSAILRAVPSSAVMTRGLPKPGTHKYRILQLLGDGAHTQRALAAEIPDARNLSSLLHELRLSGFITKADPGPQGRQVLWVRTPKGAV